MCQRPIRLLIARDSATEKAISPLRRTTPSMLCICPPTRRTSRVFSEFAVQSFDFFRMFVRTANPARTASCGTNDAVDAAPPALAIGVDAPDAMPKSTGAAVQWLNDRITILKDKKRKIDADINARRYAIALGGHWKKYHAMAEAEYTVPVTGFKTQDSAVVTFLFKDDVEKKI